MARSYATVGQMMTYAVERSVAAADVARDEVPDTRTELLLRSMLEFVLMSPHSRDAFLRTIARSDRSTGFIAAVPRSHRISPDLLAEMVPGTGGDEDGARLGIALRVGGPFGTRSIQRLRRSLGPSPDHLLITITRKADRPGAATRESDALAGVVTSSWSRLARRLPKADPGHAHLWQTIGEIGENAGSPLVQYPLDARQLLTKKPTARELRAHLDMFRRASRVLLGSSPRFSTRPGQSEAHLQTGVLGGRTGLRFAESDQGTPVHFVRSGGDSVPLGIGLPESEEDRAAAEERLTALARRTAWRSKEGALPAAEELIGSPATPEAEGARLLLWAVFNPTLLRDRGFDLAPARSQPVLSPTTLALRLVHRGDPSDTRYRIWVGGRRSWTSLIPRVTREESPDRPGETYAVAPRKKQSTAEFVWEVHRALHSLTIPPLP